MCTAHGQVRGAAVALSPIVSGVLGGAARATLATLRLSACRLTKVDVAALLHLLCGSQALHALSVARCGLEGEALVAILQARPSPCRMRCRGHAPITRARSSVCSVAHTLSADA